MHTLFLFWRKKKRSIESPRPPRGMQKMPSQKQDKIEGIEAKANWLTSKAPVAATSRHPAIETKRNSIGRRGEDEKALLCFLRSRENQPGRSSLKDRRREREFNSETENQKKFRTGEYLSFFQKKGASAVAPQPSVKPKKKRTNFRTRKKILEKPILSQREDVGGFRKPCKS